MGRKVGVVPARELARRANLFRALGAAFDITFEGREAAATAGLDGVIAFPGAHPKPGPFAILHVIGPVAKDGKAEVRFAAASGGMTSGAHRSFSSAGKLKPRGMTPITV